MKESERLRIAQNLQQIEHWRSCGHTLRSFAHQHGQTLEHWRGKLRWQQCWRSGQYARNFLRHTPPRSVGRDKDPPPGKPWSGCLLVDDYGGYKALFASNSAVGETHATGDAHAWAEVILEVGCWAHARRKFFELEVASKSTLEQTAMQHIGALYALEAQMREQQLPLPDVLASRSQVPNGTATAKAMDYAHKRAAGVFVRCAPSPTDPSLQPHQ